MTLALIKESVCIQNEEKPEKLAMWKEMHDTQTTDVRKV